MFIITAILSGHFLELAKPEKRLAIGLANSTRNAGLALALTTMNFKDQPGILAAIAHYHLSCRHRQILQKIIVANLAIRLELNIS